MLLFLHANRSITELSYGVGECILKSRSLYIFYISCYIKYVYVNSGMRLKPEGDFWVLLKFLLFLWGSQCDLFLLYMLTRQRSLIASNYNAAFVFWKQMERKTSEMFCLYIIVHYKFTFKPQHSPSGLKETETCAEETHITVECGTRGLSPRKASKHTYAPHTHTQLVSMLHPPEYPIHKFNSWF